MSPGDLMLKLAFVGALLATALFVPALRGRRSAAAGWAFVAHALLLVGALSLLWWLFLAHRFEYEYVAQYSSRALSPALTFAASWAGQEGSILLWVTLAALLGLALLRQPGALTHPAMFFVGLLQSGLLLLLLVRTPFRMSATVPADGLGLNPLLEDPWMVVHPPVLFLGYAALALPFALALAALVRQDYKEWNRMAWPWALFGVVTLGAGIVLGGIWAYKVLGWGGYWGWDPVENASLIPWLVAVALLHGLLIQRTTGSLVRTNLVLASLGWVTVLAGTYLTRSGVLQDFSVHSFTDLGLNAPLKGNLVLGLALPLVLLGRRWAAIGGGQTRWVSLSRESALWLGLVTVLVLAALVTVGTTAPVYTALAGKPASVRPAFYEAVSVPMGIALVLLMALAPALRWSRQQGLSWLVTVVPGLALGVVALVAGAIAGMRQPAPLALLGTTAIALGVNAVWMVRLFRRGWAYGAGHLGHVGIAVMVLGMVLAGTLGRSERVRLVQGVPGRALGYELTFRGERIDARGEHHLTVELRDERRTLEMNPRIAHMPRGDGVMRKPALSDRGELYLAALETQEGPAAPSEPVWLQKGVESLQAGVGYTFTGFRMESHEEMRVFADIRVRKDGATAVVSPGMQAGPQGTRPINARVDGLGELHVARIDADRGRVAVVLPAGAAPPPAAVVELSTHPFVNLVWIGALLTLVGSALAGLRRAAERAPAPRREGGRDRVYSRDPTPASPAGSR
jgi:cytochrome c-type biogenesis protein CcmF